MDDDDKRQDSIVFRGVAMHFDGVPAGGESIAVTADPTREKQGVLDTIHQLRMALEDSQIAPKATVIHVMLSLLR